MEAQKLEIFVGPTLLLANIIRERLGYGSMRWFHKGFTNKIFTNRTQRSEKNDKIGSST